MKRPKTYVRFVEVDTPIRRKTSCWIVKSVENCDELGEVEWYRPWRCYIFAPYTATVFERWCLRDIADFCETRTTEHRAQLAASRQPAEGGEEPAP